MKRPFSFRLGTLAGVLGVCAIAVFGYLGWLYMSADSGKREAKGPAPVPVVTQTIQNADFPVYLNGLGTVQPYRTVTVRSQVDGQVIKVEFRQGQMVNEGDLLVQIDPRPFQAALGMAQAKKAQDEANLKNAQLDLERYSQLAKQDYASRQQLDTQQAKVDTLNAQIKGDQASIDNAQTQLSYTTIRSPLTGKVGFRLIDPGNIVHATDQTGIVTIVKLQPISVVFTAPEENVGQINKALAAGTVPVIALSSDSTKTLAQGRLALVDNKVDQASGTIQMKATFENKDNALWPGLSVATRLLIDTQRNVLVISNDAIQHGPNGLYSFVVGKDNKVEKRDIEVGDEGTSQSVVRKGLASGDRVVTTGQYRLTEGALVTPRNANPSSSPDKEAANTAQKEP
ncbi:MAG TPA: efflux RND transporter periplasmic adaptor subunit [Pseudolabrys sp.]|nr:efflux RND transporter periplasmic adaptor subunit [Pseudolabrys sp.]